MLKGQNLKEIQDQVLRRCQDYIRFHKIRNRQRPIAPMLEEERARLMPLPVKPFGAYAETQAKVGSDLTFRCDATKYSAPHEYSGKTITVHATAYRIEAWHQGKRVCVHTRPFIQGEHQYLPEHYLPLLQSKPRAIPNAAPLKYGVLPPELERFRQLNRDKDKYEQLANILLLSQQISADILLPAVDWANRTGSPSFESVRFYLESHNTGLNAQIQAAADPIAVDKPELAQYAALFAQGADSNE
jgi:hypothetical protein